MKLGVTILTFLNACLVLGQASFTEVSSGNSVFSVQSGHGVSAADYDNDGDDDLFISSSPLKLLKNNGNFNFSDATSLSGLNGNCKVAVWFDANNDGWLDLLMANSLSARFFKNNKNGTFTELSPTETGLVNIVAAQGLFVGDFNGDQWPDIYTNNFNRQNQLFINQSNFLFHDRTANSGVAITSLGMGGVVTDFDKDND